MLIKTKSHGKPWLFLVEMAGIEPASERIDRQISTSVVDLFSRRPIHDQQNERPASRLDPKVLFHAAHGKLHGTCAFWRPILLPAQ